MADDFKRWEREGYIDSSDPDAWEPSGGCIVLLVLVCLSGAAILGLIIHFL